MNQLVYVLIGIVVVCAAAMLICRAADDTYTVEPEPEPVIPAAEQCAVQGCPREWQSARHGTQLCHTHYRELVTHRSAS